MLKRMISVFLCLLMLMLMAPSSLAMEYVEAGAAEPEEPAAKNYIALTLEAGDTIYDLCRNFGVDFIAAKAAIMELNGWSQEAQLSRLSAGQTILLPLPGYVAAITGTPDVSHDEIAYYVIPYVIQTGDNLEQIYKNWGLRFERYAGIIRLINCVDDLNVLSVGTLYYLPTTAENVYGTNYITVMYHLMRVGETAYDVFRGYGIDYNTSYPILQAYNRGNDLARISVGDKLLIPLI